MRDGFYAHDWLWLGGQGSVINDKFNAPDGPICTDLRDDGGLLSASADFKHSYPHSWRSKAKVSTAARRNGSSRWTGRWPSSRAVARWENEGGAISLSREQGWVSRGRRVETLTQPSPAGRRAYASASSR